MTKSVSPQVAVPATFFPVSEMLVHPYGDRIKAFCATVSGLSAWEFWIRSGDPNEMHDPGCRGGMLQGVAFIYIANAAVATAYPDYVMGGLACDHLSPVFVSLQRNTEVHVLLNEMEPAGDRTFRLAVEVHGPLRPGTSSFRPVVIGSVTLYRRNR